MDQKQLRQWFAEVFAQAQSTFHCNPRAVSPVLLVLWMLCIFSPQLPEFLILGISKGHILLAHLWERVCSLHSFQNGLTLLWNLLPFWSSLNPPPWCSPIGLLCCQQDFRNLEPLYQIHLSLPHPSWNLDFPWWLHFLYNPQGWVFAFPAHTLSSVS